MNLIRIDRRAREERVEELRRIEQDDFEDDTLQPPKRNEFVTLLNSLRGINSTPDGYFSTMHRYKYGAQGRDVAEAVCDFLYPEAQRQAVEEFVLNMLSISETFHMNIVDLLFTNARKLRVPRGPNFRDNADHSLKPPNVNLQQRKSAVSLFCLLWKYGMISQGSKIEEFISLFSQESVTLLRQVTEQYSDIPALPTTVQGAKVLNLSAYSLNTAYHPIYFTSVFLIEFLHQTVNDGFGIVPFDEAEPDANISTPVILDDLPPMLISRHERNSLLHHIVDVLGFDAKNGALVHVPREPLISRDKMSILSRAILACLEHIMKLVHAERNVHCLIVATCDLLADEYGVLSNRALNDMKIEWHDHIQTCNNYLSKIFSLLGLNMFLDYIMGEPFVSNSAAKDFIIDSFVICPENRKFYLTIVDFGGLPLAPVQTNEISERENMRPYPSALAQKYTSLVKMYVTDVNKTYDQLGSKIQSGISEIAKQFFNDGLMQINPKRFRSLLEDPVRKIKLTPGIVEKLVSSIRNQTEEHVVLILLARFLSHTNTEAINALNYIFKTVFCTRYNMSEEYCRYYIHLYACLCINGFIPITEHSQKAPTEDRLFPAHLSCQKMLTRMLMDNGCNISNEAVTSYLVRCIKHLSCFNLIRISDLVRCLTGAINRLSPNDLFSFETKRLIRTVYDIIFHNYYFWYGSCPTIRQNIEKIDSKVSNMVHSLQSEELRVWYAVLINIRYTPVVKRINEYELALQNKVDDPTLDLPKIRRNYMDWVTAYRKAHSSRFEYSLTYQWFKKRLIVFCKTIQPFYAKQLDSIFPQYVSSLFSSTDDIIADIKHSIMEHLSPSITPTLTNFAETTLSLLNFTDCYQNVSARDFLPAGFHDNIFAEIRDRYDSNNLFRYLGEERATYEDLLLPPIPTPQELTNVFVSLDVLSNDTLKPLAALIAYMHRSQVKNLQLGARRVLATLMDTLSTSIFNDDEQQASVVGLLLVELVKLSVLDYNSISGIISTFLISKDDLTKLTPQFRRSLREKTDSLLLSLKGKSSALTMELIAPESHYVTQQQTLMQNIAKYKQLSLEEQLGYKVTLHADDTDYGSGNRFALGLQMVSSFMQQYIICLVAHTLGISENIKLKITSSLREQFLYDYTAICLYSQYKFFEFTGLLTSVIDDMISYSMVLVDLQRLAHVSVDFTILPATITTISKYILAKDSECTNSLNTFCKLISRFFKLESNVEP